MRAPLLLLLLLPAAPAAAALSSATLSDIHELAGLPLEAGDARPLPVFPENLIFDVSWGVIGVGQATLSVPELVEFAGRPAYHIVSRAVSNPFCDTFYKVRDLNESWLDARTLSSLGYAKQLREGRFFRDEWVAFDASDQTFLAKTVNRDGTFSYHAGTVPVKVQDILSSLSFVRAQDLKPDAEVVIDVNTKENWPLVVRVTGRETVETPAGSFRTLVLEPGLRQEGLFIQKGKRLRIWVTDDLRRMPVQMKVEVFFGNITARLAKML